MHVPRLAAFLVALFVVLAPCFARAQDIALDFDVDPEDRPEHLCVLYFLDSDPAYGIRFDKDTLSKIADKSGAQPNDGSAGDLRDAGMYVAHALPDATLLVPKAKPGSSKTTTAPPGKQRIGADPASSLLKRVRQAFELLARSNARKPDDCVHKPESCSPMFEVRSSSANGALAGAAAPLIQCTSTTQRQSASSRVLFVEVRMEPRIPIQAVQLQGRIAVLNLKSSVPNGSQVVATVLGGDYAAGAQEFAIGSHIHIALEPRCHTRRIALPSLAAPEEQRSDQVVLSVEGKQCAFLPRADTYSIVTPRTSPGTLKTLTARVLRDGRLFAEYRGEWWSAIPPPEISMRARSVSFRWVAPCEYPSASVCPTAALPEAGLVCKAKREQHRTCAYTCEPRSNTLTFELPAKVVFSSGVQQDRWEDRLSFAGQTLTEYASRETRQLALSFDRSWYDEVLLTRGGDRISLITILGPDGSLNQVKPPAIAMRGRQLPRVTLPGVVCGDLVRYRVVGDRAYDESVAPVRRGRIHIANPGALATNLFLSGNAGGGFVKPTGDRIWRPYGLAEVTVRWMPNPVHSTPLKVKALDSDIGYLLAEQSYSPLRSDKTSEAVQERSSLYNRFYIDVGPMWFHNEYLQAGFRLGPGLGFALYTEDETKVGETQFFGTAAVVGRYVLGQKFAFEAQARGVFPETVYRYESKALTGSPTREEDTMASFFFGLSARFTL